ncbi:MAG: permease-like cell division protein FtsX [Gemmatimonadota bacterium]
MSYAIREALAAFRRAPVLTGLAAAMVGLALFVVGLFGLVAANLRSAVSVMEERVEIVAYLNDDVRVDEIELAVAQFEERPEVQRVIYVSKAQALEQAHEEFPAFQEVFSGLAVNPLPASLEIQLLEGSRTEDVVSMVAEMAEAFPFVEEVDYGREWVEQLFAVRRAAAVTAMVLGIAFGVVAALIIGTALRIAIFARKDEIYIMRLVGARDGFIRLPFVLEGALAGLLGGVVALGLTWATYRAVSSLLFEVEWIPWSWVAGGIAGGVLFGVLSSSLAVRRHLREVV